MDKINFVRRCNEAGVYMHITRDLSHDGSFNVRVPQDRLMDWNEDDETPRVCVSEDLNGCLRGAGIEQSTLVKVFFVDVDKLDLRDSVIKWDRLYREGLVTDAVCTKEAWILKDFVVPKEDSAIVMLNNIDDSESMYLVEYELKKEADELGIDEVDLHEERFGFVPRCVSLTSIDEKDVIILDSSYYETFWMVTQMIEDKEDCLEDLNPGLYDYEDEEDELMSFRYKNGIHFLGEGNARKVFSLNEYAVKLPKNQDGELQSKNEYSIYNTMKSKVSILNPSYSLIYGDLVFQPRLVGMGDVGNGKYKDILMYLRESDFEDSYVSEVESSIETLVRDCGLIKEDLLKLSSWGVKEDYDEKVYLLDYGTTEDIYSEFYE